MIVERKTKNQTLLAKAIVIVSIVLFSSTSSMLAQTVQKLNIQFPSNESALTDAAKKSIDSIIHLLANIPQAFNIEVIGHSDSSGAANTNKELSIKRAKETAKYFAGKGFKKSKFSGRSSTDPVTNNATDKGKQLNRRVEIIISVDIPKVDNIAGFKINDQEYNIPVSIGGTIDQASGTKIIIPPNAFVDADGKEIEGGIEIIYTEYRDPIDFILSNIPMNFVENGKSYPFNSGGMFKILAYKNGQPVFLKAGKRISIDFAMANKTPGFNFYGYGGDSTGWQQLSKLQDNHGPDSSRFFVCGFHRGQPYCNMDECNASYFIANTGIKYSDPSNSNRFLSEGVSKVSTESTNNKEQIDSIARDISKSQHHYKVSKVKTKGTKTTFEIKCKGNTNNEFAPLENALWIYNSTVVAGKDSLFNRDWLQCEILPKDLNYSIVLTDRSDKKVQLNNVQMGFKKKVKKKNRALAEKKGYARYDSIAKEYENKMKSSEMLKSSLISKKGLLDSLFCFWDKSKKYMSPEEQLLDFDKWIAYFDNNRALMRQRYLPLRKDSSYVFCRQMVQKQIEMENKQKATKDLINKKENVAKTNNIFQSLSIQSLGVFNCDQIYRLREPKITILADYLDDKKNNVDIILIYIIDDALNGILRYDGYNNLGPSVFVCSAASHNTLIAFDEKFNAYIVRPDKFVVKTSGIYTFTLEKLSDVKSKEGFK